LKTLTLTDFCVFFLSSNQKYPHAICYMS
jgi:hypothetical protein